MDAVREQLKNPTATAVGGLIIGAVVGLLVLGWWLFPVQWTDASPEHLRADLQESYLRMAIDSFTLAPNQQLARERYRALGEAGPRVLAEITSNPGAQAAGVTQFSTAVEAQVSPVEVTPAPEEGGSLLQNGLIVMCGVTAVLAVALALVFFFRRQQVEGAGAGVGVEPGEAARREAIAAGEEPPLAQFMTTYMLGDDLFDDSFSIDSAAGEFLGECGVGIAETIGVGEPKRVSAFELWLFDKNDIQTVTKVLMSSHAFADDATRQRLAAKGEPVLAEPGSEIILETATLQLVSRVVDMSYGEGALPAESFMERITLELAVWSKM